MKKYDFKMIPRGLGNIELKPNVLHMVDFNRPTISPNIINEEASTVLRYEHTLAKKVVEYFDEEILIFLYEEYKNTDVNTLLVLDKSRFKDFILKYIPIYLKEIQEREE